jgi:hypothetical protein
LVGGRGGKLVVVEVPEEAEGGEVGVEFGALARRSEVCLGFRSERSRAWRWCQGWLSGAVLR